MTRLSRTTVTRIRPGWVSSSDTRRATSRAISPAPRSSTTSGRTMTRTSRPACTFRRYGTR